MSAQLKDDLKIYYNAISSLLVGDEKTKKKFLIDFKISIGSFLEENPEATIDDVTARFGQPKEISNSFLESFDPSQIKHAVSRKKIIIMCLVIVVLFLAIYGAFEIKASHSAANGYGVEEIDEIIITAPLTK